MAISDAWRDRLLGSLLGLAVGDALGTAVEFQARDSFPPVTGMTGGGVFNLAPGQWTDDTSMALCIAASLTETGAYDPLDQLARVVRWYRDGYLSSTGECFDIGNRTRTAVEQFEMSGEPYRATGDGMSAGNGSLMRLAPVAMAFCDDPDAVVRLSADSSRTTHPAIECVEACGAYGRLIAAAIEGASRTELFVLAADLGEQVTDPILATILRGSYRVKGRDEISSSGYVLHSLEAALWAFARADDFTEGALLAVNLGDDADTVGAIYGQLAGAFHGRQGIPESWRDKLHAAGLIEDLAAGIADRVGSFTIAPVAAI